MRKLIFSSIAILAIAAMAFTTVDPLSIGSPMPKATVKMQDVSGKEIAIQDVKKQNGILVMFSCNTCPYVIKNQERTIAVCNYADKMNVGVIILNSNEAQRNDVDSYAAMQTYAKDQKYNWNYVVDKGDEVANAFGANRTPECFLFDKNLVLVYHGAIDDNPSDDKNVTRQHLKEAITELATGKDITVKESRSVGCSIKRS
ncbi:MAG TPA: thioredoxin family protein [Ferruginibacter sp.]|jgi:peroxiredoxin|nr:thioredoxin family protein [Ferruginibacter sp.]